ncbi:antibiotic biosynthesis monooxygenase [Acinetobacter sp. ANC 4558]|uniref:putative quinol monooxygenase n=1 Tax=Acinetobacter sp. ANC 4558 TaxID=1977876 RepID=UPI000A3502C7|nr:antibiotic biosynthesis monooxygenase [Acinetobacter sp. ANC 4558]OTG80766.1 antibiotic biosynthesis monooxygenase [Acinetobacter sp. ANC 4558]
MIKLCGQLICISQKEIEIVTELLPEHTKLTLQENGCISFHVKQSQNPYIWEVEEVFVNINAFQNHQQRTINSYWGNKTKMIKRAYEIFTIE